MRTHLLAFFTASSLFACGLGGSGPTRGVDGTGTGGGSGTVTHKRVFVTHSTWTGNLKAAGGGADGLAGADSLCTTSAQAANLGGTWKAFLPPPGGRAEDRMADVGPWYLVNGEGPVFNNKANLSTAPLVGINRTENGAQLIYEKAWLGDGAETCSGWTSGDTMQFGGAGRVGSTTSPEWRTQSTKSSCNESLHLYCLEQ